LIARQMNEEWITKAYKEAAEKDYKYSSQELVDFTFDRLTELVSEESAIRYLFKAGIKYVENNEKYINILKQYV